MPEEVWCHIHNVGGGDQWRMTSYDFQKRLCASIGVPDMRGWYERGWFPTRNFHGAWFADSDRLQELVPFRTDTVDGTFASVARRVPRHLRLGGSVPPAPIKHLVMAPLVRRPRGMLHAVRTGDPDLVSTWCGSPARLASLGDWSTFVPASPARTPVVLLDHGYDESIPVSQWGSEIYAGVAAHRGGRLLTETVTTGDPAARLSWECAFGHAFEASPRLVLTGGHWCPVCVCSPETEEEQALHNAFLAQVAVSPRSVPVGQDEPA